MSDDIKLNGQCEHGYPADGTCPYCHPAKDRPEKHDRDDIKKAAEIEIAVNDKGDRSVFFARAYLALREQVETVALPALKRIEPILDVLELFSPGGAEDGSIDKQIRAAIKAIEEGRA